ncbi:MAG: hypothetical protein JXA37_03570 [Chloroflexia bacterium]|nr:hypothetical protein [Chloroflexia bacterium]
MLDLDGFSITAWQPNSDVALAVPEGRLQSVLFSTAAQGGFKEATFPIEGEAGDLLRWYYLLGKRLRLAGPGGGLAFEGLVYGLSLSGGMAYSLDNYYNAVNVVYTTYGGEAAATGWAVDEEGIALRGRKELVLQKSDVPAAVAQNHRDLALYFGLRTLTPDPFEVPIPYPKRRISAEVRCLGLYASLGHRRWIQALSGVRDTGLQVQDIVAATNFYGDSVDWLVYDGLEHVDTTGISVERERVDTFMTYQQEVERLATLGTSDAAAKDRLLWFQVWDDRRCCLTRWGQGDFPATDYLVDSRSVFDAGGAQIPDWLARADSVMLTPNHLLLGYGAYDDVLETPFGFYLLETEYRLPAGKPQKGQVTPNLRVKPAGSSDIYSLIGGMVGA